MNILLFMIPLALVLLVVAIWAFVWAVRRGQFEDLDTPAIDILREDATERATRARVERRRAEAGAAKAERADVENLEKPHQDRDAD